MRKRCPLKGDLASIADGINLWHLALEDCHSSATSVQIWDRPVQYVHKRLKLVVLVNFSFPSNAVPLMLKQHFRFSDLDSFNESKSEERNVTSSAVTAQVTSSVGDSEAANDGVLEIMVSSADEAEVESNGGSEILDFGNVVIRTSPSLIGSSKSDRQVLAVEFQIRKRFRKLGSGSSVSSRGLKVCQVQSS